MFWVRMKRQGGRTAGAPARGVCARFAALLGGCIRFNTESEACRVGADREAIRLQLFACAARYARRCSSDTASGHVNPSTHDFAYGNDTPTFDHEELHSRLQFIIVNVGMIHCVEVNISGLSGRNLLGSSDKHDTQHVTSSRDNRMGTVLSSIGKDWCRAATHRLSQDS
jgi:hypothetical protein